MFFWNSLAFSMIQRTLAIWSLVPLPFLKPAWTSGSSRFTYCWSLENFEHYFTSVWDEGNESNWVNLEDLSVITSLLLLHLLHVGVWNCWSLVEESAWLVGKECNFSTQLSLNTALKSTHPGLRGDYLRFSAFMSCSTLNYIFWVVT